MFFFGKPRPRDVERFFQKALNSSFSYEELRATQDQIPTSFTIDRYAQFLGHGREIFEAGKKAILDWKMYPAGWTRIHCFDELAENTTFVAEIAHFGFHSLNACRVLYFMDDKAEEERGDVTRFGFGFGTLEDHAECGEEVFTIEWHAPSDEVYFRILAMSKPQSCLVRLAWPLGRMLQKRFAYEARQSVLQAVKQTTQT